MIPDVNKKLPCQCTSIDEVREEIDNIDKVIISLLSQRFGYVKEVVKYKKNDAASIEASGRRNAVIESRRRWAEENGLDPDAIGQMYANLIQYFISEEKKIKNL